MQDPSGLTKMRKRMAEFTANFHPEHQRRISRAAAFFMEAYMGHIGEVLAREAE